MVTSKPLALDPDAVRERCQNYTEVATKDTRVCSYLTNDARVTIYCVTGTVGIARVVQSRVRQVFRRNITSLDMVESLLKDPPTLEVMDHSLLNLPSANVQSVGVNLQLIDLGISKLQSEREHLHQHAQFLEPLGPCPPQQTHPSQKKNALEFQFSLPADPMKHVDQCLTDIRNMGRLVQGVSTNGKGTVFLYGNGGVAYTPHIPRALYHKLSQLRTTKHRQDRPNVIVLGTRDRFFVSFNNGSFGCKGPKALDKELRKGAPMAVTFGSTYDTFAIVWSDGTYTLQGKGIPKELEAVLEARNHRPVVSMLNLGPSGEWFVRLDNGKMWWGGISKEMRESLKGLVEEGHVMNYLDFGDDGSYFISYD